MKQLIESVLENLSSREVFLFRVICTCCGGAYGNKPRRFSRAGALMDTQSERIICDALYEQEFHLARQVAIRDAAEQMNRCPVCRRLVCNSCFLICEELDLCRECADRLGQTGISIFHGVVDAAV